MVAKLRACQRALDGGVGEVVIADGREPDRLAALVAGKQAARAAHGRGSRRRHRDDEQGHGTDDGTDRHRDVKALEAEHVLQTYKRAPVVFVRGEGRVCSMPTAASYLDFISGIGVVVLGHAHPGLAAAVADQAETLIQTSNLYYHPLQGQLAARLAALSGLQRTFFCNSGTEAVEACLKFARRYWFSKGEQAAHAVSSRLQHGFSGRTMGALSVTANRRTASRSSR